MVEPFGALMVMMDPPAADESEFHDWYDIEHVPERAAIENFLSVERFVCLDGWPKYMACYDLKHPNVLKEDAYLAISGDKFSPWSKRIISQIHGWTRMEGIQIYPGNLLLNSSGKCVRLLCFKINLKIKVSDKELIEKVRIFTDEIKSILQFRIFNQTNDDNQYYVIVELGSPIGISDLPWMKLNLPNGSIDLANIYSRYWRRS